MKRLVLSFFLVATSIIPVPSYADTILVFGQSTGLNLFTGDETAGTTVLDANVVPIIITTLNEAASNIAAFFSLDATSTAAATNPAGDIWTQAYSGNFEITDGLGFNYLSGNFNGIQLGLDGGGTLVFGAAQPPGSLSLTSDVLGMPLDIPRAMALSLSDVTPGVSIVNGSFGDFTANISGTYSADAVAVPEPMVLSLLGLGLLGYSRRKRQ